MGYYDDTDLHVSPSGDLSIASNGDLQLAVASGVLQQDVSFRLRTSTNDFVPHPEVGADLDDLIGEPNTRENAQIGEGKVIRSLTYDGLVRSADLYVRAVPIQLDKVVYYIFVNNGNEQLNITPDLVFNTIQGITTIPGD